MITCILAFLLSGCQSGTYSASAPTDAIGEIATVQPTATEATAQQESTASNETAGDGNTDSTSNRGEPATFPAPIRLAIPKLDFATAVEAMAWQITEVEGERQAVWQVPEANAGWHINSVGVGAPGNMVISGHHRQGTAVFASLARGELAVGDEIYVTGEDGRTFVYQVSELVPPIPVVGATEAEITELAKLLGPTDAGTLTLLTGWPDFSDTHYLMIVATLIKQLE